MTNEDDVMEDYLGGEEFNVGSKIFATSTNQGEIQLDRSLGEQDVSLLVSPSFSDYVRDKNSQRSINGQKSKSRCFSEENDMDIAQQKIIYNAEKIENISPETNILLDNSFCPSLGLGSVESKEDVEYNTSSPQTDEYVFKASSYRNNTYEATSNKENQSTDAAVSDNKKIYSGSANKLIETTNKRGEDKESDYINKAAHSSKMKVKSTDDEIQNRSMSIKLKSTLVSELTLSTKSEVSSIEKSVARRNSWNHDINDKLAGVTHIMDSLKGNDERKRSKSFENRKNMEKTTTDANAAYAENDFVSHESSNKISTSLKENKRADYDRIQSLEELKKKYSSPEKENTSSNSPSSVKEKKNNHSLNPIGFIRGLLSPPKFLSPSKQQQEKYKSIIDNISLKNDASYEKPETPNSSSKNKSNTRDENADAGIGHWRLSVEVPRENDLKLNVSPISLALSNSEKEDDDNGSIDSSEQILGEKILENEEVDEGLACRQNASSYFSPAESSDYSTFSSKDIGSASVEVANITRKQHASRASIPVTRLQSISGRRLSMDKMNESKTVERKSPLMTSRYSNHGISNSVNVSREAKETPPKISFTSVPDLSSAKKKVGASSLALVERLKGASQRRTLLVSRSGKQSTTNESLEFDRSNQLLSENRNVTKQMNIATNTKADISSGRNSCFKPFKARPLPLTTSILGHGGQLGVPKIPKKRTTNPLSPKLGTRRRNKSPSRAIQRVRAAEKAKKKILKEAFGEMPEFKSTNTILRKKLPPEEDPYIPFKARPIQTNPKPLRSIGNLSKFVKDQDNSSKKIKSMRSNNNDKQPLIPISNHQIEKKRGKTGKSKVQYTSQTHDDKQPLKMGMKHNYDENISYKVSHSKCVLKNKPHLEAVSKRSLFFFSDLVSI